MVPPAGIEPATQGFSVPRSTNWATEAYRNKASHHIAMWFRFIIWDATRRLNLLYLPLMCGGRRLWTSPQEIYSCILAETALHITRRIFHLSALDCSAPFVSLLDCCLRLYKMHINSCGEFHSATSCPESKRSLAEPMRAVWLSASFYNLSAS